MKKPEVKKPEELEEGCNVSFLEGLGVAFIVIFFLVAGTMAWKLWCQKSYTEEDREGWVKSQKEARQEADFFESKWKCERSGCWDFVDFTNYNVWKSPERHGHCTRRYSWQNYQPDDEIRGWVFKTKKELGKMDFRERYCYDLSESAAKSALHFDWGASEKAETNLQKHLLKKK